MAVEIKPGHGDGHDHPQQDPQARAAIQAGGILQLDRHGLEEGGHHPDRIGQGKAHIGDDQHDGLVDQLQAGGDDKQRDDQRYFRDHARAQDADLDGAG